MPVSPSATGPVPVRHVRIPHLISPMCLLCVGHWHPGSIEVPSDLILHGHDMKWCEICLIQLGLAGRVRRGRKHLDGLVQFAPSKLPGRDKTGQMRTE